MRGLVTALFFGDLSPTSAFDVFVKWWRQVATSESGDKSPHSKKTVTL
ncbi:MAG: hypothetical protein K1Y36_09330 [Blastocatellia bacterium]|nr:hypothetical protein [Blastocatellia bacterium]